MRTCRGSCGASRTPSRRRRCTFFLFVAVDLLASAPLLSATRHVHKQLSLLLATGRPRLSRPLITGEDLHLKRVVFVVFLKTRGRKTSQFSNNRTRRRPIRRKRWHLFGEEQQEVQLLRVVSRKLSGRRSCLRCFQRQKLTRLTSAPPTSSGAA